MSPVIGGFLGFMCAFIFIAIGLARFAKGIDETYSLANVQVILWSGMIMGSYLSLAVLKEGFLGDINANLLGLMGISGGSYVAAKTIRSMQETVPKELAKGRPMPRTRGLFSQERAPDKLSVAKLQMTAWTLVSLMIYVVLVAINLSGNKPELPDVGSGLLTLMGISHGVYIGDKSRDKPLG